jgi:hypothetical protein
MSDSRVGTGSKAVRKPQVLKKPSARPLVRKPLVAALAAETPLAAIAAETVSQIQQCGILTNITETPLELENGILMKAPDGSWTHQPFGSPGYNFGMNAYNKGVASMTGYQYWLCAKAWAKVRRMKDATMGHIHGVYYPTVCDGELFIIEGHPGAGSVEGCEVV